VLRGIAYSMPGLAHRRSCAEYVDMVQRQQLIQITSYYAEGLCPVSCLAAVCADMLSLPSPPSLTAAQFSTSGCTPCCCALPPDPGTTIIFTISGHKKKKDKLLTMDESEITYEMVSRKLREIITSRGRKGTDKLEQVRA
jgi:Eukaryotic translation initiation factor 3 subunit 8 N-terminus